MGMFDYIVCKMPLPGTAPAWFPGGEFQTKDTPEQYMATYTIEEDGTLVGPNAEGFTGDVNFYGSNSTGCHLGARFSRNGEDVEDVEYVANVVKGHVTALRQTEYNIEPGVVSQPMGPVPTPEDIAWWRERRMGLKVGQEVYMLYGHERGYRAVITSESDDEHRKELCIKALEGDGEHVRTGDIEIVRRSDLGHTMFMDEAEAREYRTDRKTSLDALRERYDAIRRAWYVKRGEAMPPDLAIASGK